MTEGVSEQELAAIERHEREVAQRQAAPSRALERATGLALILISAVALIGSRQIEVRVQAPGVGPRWWPSILAGIAVVLSITLTIIGFVRLPAERDGIESASRPGWVRFGTTIVITTLFIVAWWTTGNFVVPCVLMLAALLFSYGSRSWRALLLFPVLTTALVYVLFHLLLQVPL